MKRRSYAPSRPPQALRRVGLQLDNIALVPASLLPLKDQWQRMANGLPAGDVLMVVPTGNSRLRKVLHTLSPVLKAHGWHITTLPAEWLVQAPFCTRS